MTNADSFTDSFICLVTGKAFPVQIWPHIVGWDAIFAAVPFFDSELLIRVVRNKMLFLMERVSHSLCFHIFLNLL